MQEVPLHPFRNSAVFNPVTHLFYIPSNPWRVTLRLERLVNRNSGIKKNLISYCVLNLVNLIRYLWILRNEMVFRTLYKKFRLWNLGKLFSFMINLNLSLVNKHRVAPTQTNPLPPYYWHTQKRNNPNIHFCVPKSLNLKYVMSLNY